MKKIFTTIILALTITISCKAQLNNLNETELMYGIKFNNITLKNITESNGNLSQIKSFFGNDIQQEINNTSPSLAKDFYNNNISLGFEDQSDTGNNYDLSSIYVLNSSITINVQSLSIKLGDHKSKFSGLLFNPNCNSYVFTNENKGTIALSFKIDNQTDKVSEIKLIVY